VKIEARSDLISLWVNPSFPAERIAMLIFRPSKWVLAVLLTATAIVVHSFVPAMGDGLRTLAQTVHAKQTRLLPSLPAPTCAAPKKIPAAPAYEPAPAKPPVEPMNSTALLNLPAPIPDGSIANAEPPAREEFQAPAVEYDEEPNKVVTAKMPVIIPMPAPAPPLGALPIIQPAVALESKTLTDGSVDQVAFEENSYKLAKCFRGHCPVGIARKELIRANNEISLDHGGIRYYFANNTARDEFQASPEKFVPAMGGDCIVTFARTGDRVTGNCVTIYEGRQYWFADAQARSDFKTDPKACLARVAWHKKFLGMQ
jgi:YHS domain-containing protein